MDSSDIKFILSLNDSQFEGFIQTAIDSVDTFSEKALYDAVIFRSVWGEPMTLSLRKSLFSAFHTVYSENFSRSMPFFLSTILTKHLHCEINDLHIVNSMPKDVYTASRLALVDQAPENVKEIIQFLSSEFVSSMFKLEFDRALQCMSALVRWSNNDEIKRQMSSAYNHINTYNYCFELDLPKKEMAIYEHCCAHKI